MTQSTDVLPPSSPSAAGSSWFLKAVFAVLFLLLAAVVAVVVLLVSTVFLQLTDERPDRLFSSHNAPVVLPLSEPTPDPASQIGIWDGHGPLNVMLLGVDQVDCRYGDDQPTNATRTDTIILVRLDPKTRRVAMLSLPRDLWVSIPGVGTAKINTAHVSGESMEFEPGGGPGLLKETIWENLDLQVHRFVRIDLTGFEQILEAMGGLDMDLPASPDNPDIALYDDNFPDGRCGIMTISFKPGPQHLTPAQVMQYARSRYSTSDFDRSRRQQEVLLAMRERLLKPDMILKAPQLLKEFLGTVDSDFTTREILALAPLAQGLRAADVVRLQIDNESVYGDRSLDGQSILVPIPDRVNEVLRRYQAFEPPPTPTPMPTRDPNAPPTRRWVAPTLAATGEGQGAAAGDAATQPADAGAPPAEGPTAEPTAAPAP